MGDDDLFFVDKCLGIKDETDTPAVYISTCASKEPLAVKLKKTELNFELKFTSKPKFESFDTQKAEKRECGFFSQPKIHAYSKTPSFEPQGDVPAIRRPPSANTPLHPSGYLHAATRCGAEGHRGLQRMWTFFVVRIGMPSNPLLSALASNSIFYPLHTSALKSPLLWLFISFILIKFCNLDWKLFLNFVFHL